MKMCFPCGRTSLRSVVLALVLMLLAPQLPGAAPGPALSAAFSSITAGNVVNLTSEGEIDWVHWGLYTETSLDRKAGVLPQISDFTLLDAPSGFAFVFQFSDNENGYSWSDGSPTPSVNDT